MKKIIFLLLITSFIACNQKKSDNSNSSKETSVTPKKQRPFAIDSGKFFEADGRKMLYGGKDSLQHWFGCRISPKLTLAK